MESIDQLPIRFTTEMRELLENSTDTEQWLASLSEVQLEMQVLIATDILTTKVIKFYSQLYYEFCLTAIGLYLEELGIDEVPKSEEFLNKIFLKHAYNIILYHLSLKNRIFIDGKLNVYRIDEKLFRLNPVYYNILENHYNHIKINE